MNCPICGERARTVETNNEGENVTYRIKKCKNCGYKFVTEEIVTDIQPYSVTRGHKIYCNDDDIKQIPKTKNTQICQTCGFVNDCDIVTQKIALKEGFWCWCK